MIKKISGEIKKNIKNIQKKDEKKFGGKKK